MVAITMVFAPIIILVGLVATLVSDIGDYILLGGLFLFFLIIGIALVTGHAIGLVAGVKSMADEKNTTQTSTSFRLDAQLPRIQLLTVKRGQKIEIGPIEVVPLSAGEIAQ